jgi:hypothetical protein
MSKYIWKAIDKYVRKRIIHMTPFSQSVLLWKILLKGATYYHGKNMLLSDDDVHFVIDQHAECL